MIFEFIGALVLGRVSQDTISGGIADISAFTHDPEFFAYGMMWALLVGGIWQIYASYKELNVSATHSIIGAIVGFSMAYKGKGAVIWAQEQIVCTGPLTGFNHDWVPGSPGAVPPYSWGVATPKGPIMRNNILPDGLIGTYTVPMDFKFNVLTGAALSGNYTSQNKWGFPTQPGLMVPARDSSGAPINGSLPTLSASWLAMDTGYNVSCIALSSNYGGGAGGSFVTGLNNWNYSLTCSGPPLSQKYTILDDCLGNNATVNGPYGSCPLSYMFTLKTATSPFGAPWPCGGSACPLTADVGGPGATTVVNGEFYYAASGAVGVCTTDSNKPFPFPPYKGVLIIVLSWFFSPVLTGIASAILFLLSRTLVLRSPNAYKRSFFVLPPMAFLTFWVNIYFVLTKGAAKVLSRDAQGWTTVRAAWISAACAGGVSLFSIVVVAPLVHRRITATMEQEREAAEAKGKEKAEALESGLSEKEQLDAVGTDTKHIAELTGMEKRKAQLSQLFGMAQKAAMHGMEVNIHDIVETDPLVEAIHKNAEIFDEKAERVFAYMQVFSAICVIFAHGAGEVGYMSGPMGAIFAVVRSGTLTSSSSPPMWTVLIGAFGLIVGLGTYGYSVCRAVGTRLAKLTASRGFAAELATSMIIMIAAQYSLPTSSSQCITGGIIGIALCEGRGGLNFKFLFQTFMSWVWTMIFVAMITAFFFSQGAYAPSAQMSRQINYYESAITSRANFILNNYQTMLKASGYAASTASDGKTVNDVFMLQLSQTIANTGPGQYYSYNPAPAGFYPGNVAPVIQTVAPWQVVGYLDTALALVQMSTMPNPAGYFMCNGNVTNTTNYYTVGNATTGLAPKFPWTQKTYSTAYNPATGYVRNQYNPCTKPANTGATAPTVKLTPVTMLGPSVYSTAAAGVNIWETLDGTPVYNFLNGTVWQKNDCGGFNVKTPVKAFVSQKTFGQCAVGFPLPTYPSNSLRDVTGAGDQGSFGNVVLDQIGSFKPCQQAPCNQAACNGAPCALYAGTSMATAFMG